MSTHPTALKRCSKCRVFKPVEAFGVESRRPDGLRCYCRECGRPAEKSRRSRPSYQTPAALAKQKKWYRTSRLRQKYGIDEEDYQARLVQQDYACAICRSRDPKTRYGVFSIDHDHSTGAIRGLLCTPCNRALGQFGDNAEGVRRVLTYLGE
jgi:hypothetical protein